MLALMMEMQGHICDMLEVPRDLSGIEEAVVGMMKESAETLEQVMPGSRAWKKVNFEEADKEAVDVLLYLLEYFVLRGHDANDVYNMYADKVDIVAQRQMAKWAADKVK